MPRSALAAGCVDAVAPVEELANMLALYGQRFPLSRSPDIQVPGLLAHEEAQLQAILKLVLEQTGIDFTAYKSATIRRRLFHHLTLQHQEQLADFLTSLRTHPEEVEALAQDLLVSVTSFFRDPEAFEVLATLAFPRIMQRKVPGDSIRVWVMGCATGEEVYSLAICLLELLGDRAAQFPLSLFASDLDMEALDYARAGIYDQRSLTGALPAAPGTLLYQSPCWLPDRQSDSRALRLCPPQHHPRPTVLPDGPDQLSQCADLPGGAAAAKDSLALPLRAQS